MLAEAAMDTTRLPCPYHTHVAAAGKPPSLLYSCAELPVGSRLAHTRYITLWPVHVLGTRKRKR